MKNLVLLEYIFMFNPSETFSHLYDFEKTLTEFLNSKGLEATIVKTVNGYQGRQVLLIKRRETLTPSINPTGRPKSIKRIVKDMGEKKMRIPNTKIFKTK
jgi:glutathione synthase/RimK-type ligase-like ATP-grasp enzyme